MSVPILSVDQMRQWEDATWAAGRTESDVMCQAGKAIGLRALGMTRPGDRLLILAGKGHNGDDARLAAGQLADREVVLLPVADPVLGRDQLLSQVSPPPALIVDGLFGIGLNRPLSGDWLQLIEQVNRLGVPVLSVDTPSGLHADTGQPQGTAVRATVTVTLGAPKRGLLAPGAWPYVGRLEVAADIGLVECPVAGDLQWTMPGDFCVYPPPRPVTGHKGTFGHIAIMAGSLGYHGAAVLAARGALRARPGLVTVITQEIVYHPVAGQLQAAMVHPWRQGAPLPESATCLVVGPGLASAELPAPLRAEVIDLWRKSKLPVIADASALDWLPPKPMAATALRLMTPHPGEAARLLKMSVAEVQADRPSALRELSRQWGDCWVVLKGHQSLVGRSMGPLYVNSSGNPYLAQGGSGDVLAGYLGGLMAQPDLAKDPLSAIRYGVWQHGACADSLQSSCRNWTVDELIQVLGNISDVPPTQ